MIEDRNVKAGTIAPGLHVVAVLHGERAKAAEYVLGALAAPHDLLARGIALPEPPFEGAARHDAVAHRVFNVDCRIKGVPEGAGVGVEEDRANGDDRRVRRCAKGLQIHHHMLHARAFPNWFGQGPGEPDPR